MPRFRAAHNDDGRIRLRPLHQLGDGWLLPALVGAVRHRHPISAVGVLPWQPISGRYVQSVGQCSAAVSRYRNLRKIDNSIDEIMMILELNDLMLI